MSTRKLIVVDREAEQPVDLEAFAEAYARVLIAEAAVGPPVQRAA